MKTDEMIFSWRVSCHMFKGCVLTDPCAHLDAVVCHLEAREALIKGLKIDQNWSKMARNNQNPRFSM